MFDKRFDFGFTHIERLQEFTILLLDKQLVTCYADVQDVSCEEGRLRKKEFVAKMHVIESAAHTSLFIHEEVLNHRLSRVIEEAVITDL